MKTVHFDEGQRSEEWLEWRNNGLGATDITVVMDSNPYKSKLQLWEEKCGYRDQPQSNAAMEHGMRFEEHALNLVNQQFDFNFKPVCIEHPKHSFMHASLDGYDSSAHCVCEIKCPVSEKTLDLFIAKRHVPSYWITQIEWQLFLSKAYKAILGVYDYRTDSVATLEFMPNQAANVEMEKEAKAFWHLIQSGIPPKASESDYIEIEDPELVTSLFEYETLLKEKKRLETDLKELKQKIVEFGDDGNFSCAGFKVTRTPPRKTYNIEQMRLDGIDVDSYRKSSDGIGFYTIRPPK